MDTVAAASRDGERVLELSFQDGQLNQVRSAVAAHAQAAGLADRLANHLVLIASELVVNAVRHGGGRGRLRLWEYEGEVLIQVEDSGPGMPVMSEAIPRQRTGRGLWTVRSLAENVVIDSDADGTTVTVLLGNDR